MEEETGITGRYSSKLPKGLKSRYEDGLRDPHLVTLRSEIALLDSRIQQLTANVSDGDSDFLWKKVSSLWRSYVGAVDTANEKSKSRLFLEINALVEEGGEERQAWTEIITLIEVRRRLVDAEQRRMVTSKQMVTVEQAMLMVTASIAALQEVVFLYADTTTARHILRDAQIYYKRLISVGPDSQPDGRSLAKTDR